MGLIPKVDTPAPAFIHVDVDDLWAIAECYGIGAGEEYANHVSRDALPRFQKLFNTLGLQATFFVVGRDLESPAYVNLVKGLLAEGHRMANHSYSHDLRFRNLGEGEMEAEIARCHQLAEAKLSVQMKGFRAPGYAWSERLLDVLDSAGYRYDASLMPGPWGGVFREMDRRLQARFRPPGNEQTSRGAGHALGKTQYPLFSDSFHSLYPHPAGARRLVEVPSATSPLFRLPFQAGVCMRLGWTYFRACLQPYRLNRALPLTFLFHAADLADFSHVDIPLFRQSGFFNMPIMERERQAERFLRAICATRTVITTEDWLA